MTERLNPFQELYLTEGYLDGGAHKFVTEFSPLIVKHALGLFQPGNVILKSLSTLRAPHRSPRPGSMRPPLAVQ